MPGTEADVESESAQLERSLLMVVAGCGLRLRLVSCYSRLGCRLGASRTSPPGVIRFECRRVAALTTRRLGWLAFALNGFLVFALVDEIISILTGETTVGFE
jgi:hypothetical protein